MGLRELLSVQIRSAFLWKFTISEFEILSVRTGKRKRTATEPLTGGLTIYIIITAYTFFSIIVFINKGNNIVDSSWAWRLQIDQIVALH
jgi:hypothetical protein